MRLKRLDLTRYGKFTERVLDFGLAIAGRPDLHIVYGLNEAGKSTAFSAYLDLLFGIPERSPYNFLHAYGAMQIGGVLEVEGREHELVRLKQRSNALLDGAGQPVNEALLTSALGGLTRGSYRSMFSLDEHSLRDGGEAIVESKGDLGELLFSASAGLADVSAALSTAAEEAQRFHRKRARNTELAELKQQLASLKTERDAIDTFATVYAGLIAAQQQAEVDYEAALTQGAATKARHMRVDARLRALPLLQEVHRLQAELATLADLPRPPREWASALADLLRDETRLQTQMAGLVQTAERLDQEIANLVVDDRILKAKSKISDLEDGRARFRTADNDLPKRRAQLIEQEAGLAQLLKALGQPGHPDPASLILPTALTARLRDLIEERSGIVARLETAERERDKAEQALSLVQDGALPEAKDLPSPAELRQLEQPLALLQKGERQALLAVEERSLAQREEQLAQALGELHPWTGSLEELQRLAVADARQIERWRSQADELSRRLARHAERRRELEARLLETDVRLQALQGGEAIDDRTATSARQEREAAWQAHLARLDPESAAVFEQRLRADDRLTDARLARADELAQMRQWHQDRQVQAAALQQEATLAATANEEREAVYATISRAVPPAVAEAVEPDIHRLLSAMETWLAKRAECLSLALDVERGRRQRALLFGELTDVRSDLEAALAALGWQWPQGLDLRALIAFAADRAARTSEERGRVEALRDRAAALAREGAERSRDLAEAEKADRLWRDRWEAALAKTWFADEQEPSPVRAMLDALADLPSLLRERDQMAQRIDLMERDMLRFEGEVHDIEMETGFDRSQFPLAGADRLSERLSETERNHAQRQARQADLAELRERISALSEQMRGHAAQRSEMTEFFGVDSLTEVSQHMEKAAERDRLERRKDEIAAQLLAVLQAEDLTQAIEELQALDPDDLVREAAELSARLDDLDQRGRQLFADLTRARDRVAAVGGDDAVARLESKRVTILMEIEDLAIRHLRLRAGILAAERALSIYREKHRSSMMERASDAFRQITRGDYTGLAALPDKDREILIGVTRDGGSKLSDAMSTGTCYQLYLALRMAGFEEFSAVRPAIPFVADDIMETFDEFRSEEVFRLFGRMAGLGQVIYLTHHRHLCDIAKAVVPEVTIHTL
ncbi:AAA family ATPase [Rhizobium sp. SSA_523]|uniref:ATP-binding protein n=1 Tax=Rhizobium sp. SSA_523 TaxID=2952477 RepID=UPI0020909B0F|nr:AAA family ATPase [Rhizobium sp. SSA_523]MCO5731432.1 AAA family ATPase [Rhizobium sp. SSA_523]WKC22046.1 AAA family ATPase [Rhizobium sp. SSA_523]